MATDRKGWSVVTADGSGLAQSSKSRATKTPTSSYANLLPACEARISAPIGSYLVKAIETELRSEHLPPDTFFEFAPDSVRLAKTASRSMLGFMNEMALELRYHVAHAGGLSRCDIAVLNHRLRRSLRNRGGYVRPIELVAQRLTERV
jgi:Domain of unknown function (DUF6933)